MIPQFTRRSFVGLMGKAFAASGLPGMASPSLRTQLGQTSAPSESIVTADLLLWFRESASEWENALPVGNAAGSGQWFSAVSQGNASLTRRSRTTVLDCGAGKSTSCPSSRSKKMLPRNRLQWYECTKLPNFSR